MIIGTVHSKSVGKTTIAVHLAAWLNEYGFSVGIIDADWQKQCAKWLADAAPQIEAHKTSDPDEISELAEKLEERCDVVLIDGPAGLHLTPGAVLTAADTVIVPCGPTAPEIDALSMVADTVRDIQKLRADESETALPFPIIVPVRTKRRTIATQILLEEAKKLGFQCTETTIPYSEKYASLLGYRGEASRLMWQLGRAKPVREAVLNLDRLFQEMLPEAAESDPQLFARKMSRPQLKKKSIKMNREGHGQPRLEAAG